MFDRIVIPVNLAHADSLLRPLTIAAGLADRFDAEITLVGLTAAALPNGVGDRVSLDPTPPLACPSISARGRRGRDLSLAVRSAMLGSSGSCRSSA